MYTDNRTEIYIRGEEGALSTPPRIAEIAKEIEQTGIKGWDGLFWKNQYEAFQQFFHEKNLAPYFGSIDSLTRAMGDVSFDHQGRAHSRNAYAEYRRRLCSERLGSDAV